MAKAKFNAKEFLLKRGELLVMGVAGLFLFIMLIYGASMWGSANPVPTITEVQNNSKRIHQDISGGKADPEKTKDLVPEPWLQRPYEFKTTPPSVLAQAKNPMFDPVAQPSTKRENPNVLTITDYQVDLTRGAMLGYDIIFDNQKEPLIAVTTTTTKSDIDAAKLKKAAKDLAMAANKKLQVQQVVNRPPAQPMMPMMPMIPGMGVPGVNPGMVPVGVGMNPHGLQGGQFNQNSQRVETTIKYISLNEIETSVKAGNLPAFTVIPVRLVTVHAVVPYKKQLDEIKRALRLPNPPANAKKEDIERSDAAAKEWGPWYDGFEIQRRVSRVLPDGTLEVIEEWPETKDPKSTEGNYPFEEFYIDRIDSKKIADHLDDGFFPYFLKPELMLAMPLPQLAKDLNVKYPEIKMKEIVDNIEKLKRANQKEVPPSKLLEQISGSKPKKSLYKSQTAENVEGFGIDAKQFGFPIPGKGGVPAPPPPPPMVGVGPRPAGQLGTPKPPEGFDANASVKVEEGVDNFLLRFVDCNVEPGFRYEYRIRLRMVNPNYGQTDLVANPEFAKDSYKILHSKWLQLETPITVPAESYLYAHDVKGYSEQVNKAYLPDGKDATPESKALNKMLQVRDEQAVVQVATWMEQVRAGDSTKREPVGGWVVAEMPVGRGEYIGRKQIVRLPLWSSATQQYVLREVPEKILGKGKYQPKGWMVDFSTLSVMVDFEGGKVKTRSTVRFDERGALVPGTRNFDEDVATEMLIVRPDGKLVVRASQQDDVDQTRKDILTRWNDWLKEVEKHKAPGSTGEPNPFDPKKN